MATEDPVSGWSGLPIREDPLTGFCVAIHTHMSCFLFFMATDDPVSGSSGLPIHKRDSLGDYAHRVIFFYCYMAT